MADKMDAIVSDLKEAITNAGAKDTKPYDTAAVVQRIDEEQGIAWVKIPGGVDETPVKRTIACSAGDTVQVRVSGGKAFIQGNASAPPTDDRTAIQAKSVATTAQSTAQQAQETAEGVEGIATDAKSTANSAYTQATRAKNIADTTNQYFWFSNGDLYFLSPDVEVDTSKTYYERTGEEGSYVYTAVTPEGTESPVSAGWYERFAETGAHITETPQDDFIADPENGGGNLLARSNGIAIRDGLAELAQFGADGVQIGQNVSGMSRVVISEDGMQIYRKTSSGDVQIVNLGYGDGQSQGSLAKNTYYTMGTRLITTEPYDSSKIYYIGDMCVYDGKLYVCIRRKEPGVWNPADYDQYWSYYIGGYSFAGGEEVISCGYRAHAEGCRTVASGGDSHAEGYLAKALGSASHAENNSTRASGDYSHAEGSYSYADGVGAHAEGDRSEARGDFSHAEGFQGRARGRASHAEGTETVASGEASHAQNLGTYTGYEAQTAIGKYNDNQSNNAFEIGNGTSDSARSNAFTVAWDGEVEMYLDDTATSGTDYEIIQALTDLGWDADVIG